jgi:hypothetical protein
MHGALRSEAPSGHGRVTHLFPGTPGFRRGQRVALHPHPRQGFDPQLGVRRIDRHADHVEAEIVAPHYAGARLGADGE